MLTAPTRLLGHPGSPHLHETAGEPRASAEPSPDERIAQRRRRRALLETLFDATRRPVGPLCTADRNVLWRSHHVRGRL